MGSSNRPPSALGRFSRLIYLSMSAWPLTNTICAAGIVSRERARNPAVALVSGGTSGAAGR